MKIYLLGYPISSFIYAGKDFVDSTVPVYIIQEQPGYDGQFYYALAVDPLWNENPSHGITIDGPRYRQQRILYPLIVHALSIGNQKYIPAMMVGVNLVGLCALAGLGGLFALQNRKSAWFGLAFSLYPGLFVSFSRNLTEIVAVTFLLSALVTLKNKPYLSVFLLSLAILTKETTLLFALAILGVAVFQKWQDRYIYFIPIVVYALWQVVLTLKWGTGEIGFNNISFPFASFAQLMFHSFVSFRVTEMLWISLIVVFSILPLVKIFKNALPLYLIISWLLYSALLFSLSKDVWVEGFAYLRAASEWYIFGISLLLSSKTITTIDVHPENCTSYNESSWNKRRSKWARQDVTHRKRSSGNLENQKC